MKNEAVAMATAVEEVVDDKQAENCQMRTACVAKCIGGQTAGISMR